MVNDELLKDASKFIRNNPGKFEDNEDWQQLEKSHPQCYIKLMKFIMFQKYICLVRLVFKNKIWQIKRDAKSWTCIFFYTL